jgi:hypothetical protein
MTEANSASPFSHGRFCPTSAFSFVLPELISGCSSSCNTLKKCISPANSRESAGGWDWNATAKTLPRRASEGRPRGQESPVRLPARAQIIISFNFPSKRISGLVSMKNLRDVNIFRWIKASVCWVHPMPCTGLNCRRSAGWPLPSSVALHESAHDLTGLLRNERGHHHHARVPQARNLPVKPISGRPRLVAERQPPILGGKLPYKLRDRRLGVLDLAQKPNLTGPTRPWRRRRQSPLTGVRDNRLENIYSARALRS